jgi:hypothetical protein
MTKSPAPKGAARATPKTASKTTAKARRRQRKTRARVSRAVEKATAATLRETHRQLDAQFEQFWGPQLPDTIRGLAERNVAQTREAYERSKNTLQSVLDSWNRSFGAAGQSAMALNSRIIDMAERNIDTSFDFAMGLCRAKNFAEFMELQAAYLRKQFGQLRSQAEQVRLLPMKAFIDAGRLSKRNARA